MWETSFDEGRLDYCSEAQTKIGYYVDNYFEKCEMIERKVTAWSWARHLEEKSREMIGYLSCSNFCLVWFDYFFFWSCCCFPDLLLSLPFFFSCWWCGPSWWYPLHRFEFEWSSHIGSYLVGNLLPTNLLLTSDTFQHNRFDFTPLISIKVNNNRHRFPNCVLW